MNLDVIGASFGRTGTLSIKAALEEPLFLQLTRTAEVDTPPRQIRSEIKPLSREQVRAFLRWEVPVKVVSEMLGHASVSITLNTYSHVLPEMQESAARAMEDTLSAEAPPSIHREEPAGEI